MAAEAMMNKKSNDFLLALLIVTLAACTPAGWNERAKVDHALLLGYSRHCGGSLNFRNEAGDLDSALIVGAGVTVVTIIADSGPEAAIDPVAADPRLRCNWITDHKVRFDARAGKVYRFYLDRRAPAQYSILVLEGDDPRQVPLSEVPSESEQVGLQKKCGFQLPC